MNWYIFSYLGLFFAVIYRIPQIINIYRIKNASGISSYSYITHNGAYVSFIIYLISTQKYKDEWVLGIYYLMGFCQNIAIYCMKRYYENQRKAVLKKKHKIQPCKQSIDIEHSSRSDYSKRRQWFKNQIQLQKST